MVVDELSHLRDLWRRELMLRVRLIDSKIDRLLFASTGASPMPTSPPSSPIQTASPSIIKRSLEKIGREAIVSILMWGLGKLGLWLLTLVLPMLLSFGALAWMLLRRFLMG